MLRAGHLLGQYGYVLLVVWVFAEQIGLPLPAAPLLVAAGVLAGAGRLNLAIVIGLTMASALAADLSWFFVGRSRGNRVVGLLCRLSQQPDSCARRTERVYARHGAYSLLISKFLPWINAAAAPLAGAFRMPLFVFALFDFAGTLFWSATFLGLGYFLGARFAGIIDAVDRAGTWGLLLVVLAGVTAYFTIQHSQRQRFLEQLRMARISPEELKHKLDAGEQITIVDLRHALDFLPEPYTIPGAIRLPMEQLERRHQEIPRDREVIVYCTCPNEATSAMTALRLHQLGIDRVRPLAGGYFAWRKRGFPLNSQFGPVPTFRGSVVQRNQGGPTTNSSAIQSVADRPMS